MKHVPAGGGGEGVGGVAHTSQRQAGAERRCPHRGAGRGASGHAQQRVGCATRGPDSFKGLPGFEEPPGAQSGLDVRATGHSQVCIERLLCAGRCVQQGTKG